MRNILFALCALIVLAGCVLRAPVPPPKAPPQYREATREELIGRLSGGIPGLDTLKASYSAVVSGGAGEKKQSFRGVVAMARPGRLRMKASRAMLPTLFDLLCAGSEVTLHVPRERTVYRGTYRSGTAAGGIPDPLILSDILWGRGEAPRALHVRETCGPHDILYSIDAGGESPSLLRKVTFDRATLRPVRYQYYDREGNCSRDVLLGDFAAFDGGAIAVPREIVIESPGGGPTVSLRLGDIRVNTRLTKELFSFEMPPGTPVKPLEEALR